MGATISNVSLEDVSVTGSGNNVGGLVGNAYSGTNISNSYATGLVTGGKYTGGLVGTASGSTNINSSYATATVTASSGPAGGLVGRAGPGTNINNSYWDAETTKQSKSAGQDASFGKTTAEMKKQTTYKGWDFDTVWEITPENCPTLRQQK